MRDAEEILSRAEQAGMEVGPDRFELQEARDRLIDARVLAHSFDLERFLAATREGTEIAEAGVAAGRRSLADLQVRRGGLALSLIIIIAVIVALALKVREIENRTAR